jgi:hypothetical protein
MYEIRDIDPGSRDARSCEGDPFGPKEGRGFNGPAFTIGIYEGVRCVFRFRRDATRPTATGTSFAEMVLNRLNRPAVA